MSLRRGLHKINLYKEYYVEVKRNEVGLHVVIIDESQKHNGKHEKRSEEGKV